MVVLQFAELLSISRSAKPKLALLTKALVAAKPDACTSQHSPRVTLRLLPSLSKASTRYPAQPVTS